MAPSPLQTEGYAAPACRLDDTQRQLSEKTGLVEDLQRRLASQMDYLKLQEQLWKDKERQLQQRLSHLEDHHEGCDT